MPTANPQLNPLALYLAKRNFAVTSEPATQGRSTSGRSFVIQKHWASKLHYDFRLELNGTMKSWAIPKGPSLDPKDKRMAVAVEDHPFSYADFEGTIPAKQYGAGKVIIWDRGTWESVNDADAALRAGNLKFRLHGEKLQGSWALVRMKTREKRETWLLIKERDDAARSSADFSVVDELPDGVARTPTVYQTSMPATVPLTSKHGSFMSNLAKLGVPATLPNSLAPQLATCVDQVPASAAEWEYEIKFDGYRMLTRVDAGEVKLVTRNGHNWTSKVRHLAHAIAGAKFPKGWYDGEIVALNAEGVPDFGALQSAFDTPNAGDIVLYLFDLPYCDGRDLRGVPWEQRRALLKSIVAHEPNDSLRFSETFGGAASDILRAACRLGLEGVMAKRVGSRYVSQRSSDWLKLKCGERQEFVVGGFTDPKGSRDAFGALLLGVFADDGSLRYVGKVGSGFSDASLNDIATKLKPLSQSMCPFVHVPPGQKGAHWVKPESLVEVSFSAWTKDQHLRAPVFRGIRRDEAARLVARESPEKARVPPLRRGSMILESAKHLAKLSVTNGDRIVDSSTGLTKLDLVRYYELVGSLMMPHLQERPVSLVRAPDGFSGELFFQKHFGQALPTGLKALDPALDPDHAPMVTVADQSGLIASAQWNVVEFHTANARATHIKRPDRLIFDLDPGDKVSWDQVRQGTELVHELLRELDLLCFAKTSGGRGIHIVVPIKREYTWTVAKDFSRAVVTHLARILPTLFVAKSGPKNRVGKIFVDYLRNGSVATTVCAWSARARPGAGVSVPIAWDELSAVKAANEWSVQNIRSRLDTGNSPWDGYDKVANELTSAMRRLNYRPRIERSVR